MATELFPGVFVQQPDADPAPLTAFTVWDDLTGGTNITAGLTAADGVTAYVAITDSQGNILPFRGADGFEGPAFVDTGASIRYMLESSTVIKRKNAEIAALLTAGGAPTTWDNVSGKPDIFPPSGHTHPATEISDSTTVGRNLVTAVDAQAARAAIGAGTGNGNSNLTLGSDGVTAAAGNHTHAATGITFTPAGGVTATNVQTAIEQAAASGGSGGTSAVYVWRYASGGYPTLPATLPTGVLLVEAFGPVQPSTVPSWIGDVSGKALLRYEYAALT